MFPSRIGSFDLFVEKNCIILTPGDHAATDPVLEGAEEPVDARVHGDGAMVCVVLNVQAYNGRAHIRHLCKKITITSCHRYLIVRSDEKMNGTQDWILNCRCHQEKCNFSISNILSHFQSVP